MPREWRFRLHDILTALARIEQYTAGLDYQAFAADNKTFDAVVRNLEIIGESARFIPEAITTHWSTVPWARMRGLRNHVIYQYFAIDRSEIWSTVVQDLPPLVSQLRAILESDYARGE